MKKRVVYLLVLMITLSKVGMGQSITLDAGYGLENCDYVTVTIDKGIYSTANFYKIIGSVDGVTFNQVPTSYSSISGTTASSLISTTGYFVVNFYFNTTLLGQSSSASPVHVIINPLPNATITGSTSICKNATSPNLTFLGSSATSPYLFTYTINSGSNQTITTTSGSSILLPVSTSSSGTFTYTLISVKELSTVTQCSNTIAGQTATIIIHDLPDVTYTAAANSFECQNNNITYSTQNGQNNYSWSLPGILNTDYSISSGGISNTSNTVTLKWLTTGSKTVQVNYFDLNGCTASINKLANTTVNPLPNATITGGTSVCQNAASPSLTFTGSNATSPYVFTYTINSGSSQVITTTSGNAQNLSVPTSTSGPFTYNLVSVKEIGTSTQCSNSITGQSAIVTVNPLPSATIIGGTSVCQNAASPSLTFTGSNATSPYVFTYTINSSSSQVITTTSGNAQNLSVPTSTSGPFTYNLVSVKETGTSTQCSNSITGQSAIVTVNPLPSATITGGTSVCQNAASPSLTFTGSNATSPYVFTYTINSSSSQVITTTSGNAQNLSVPTSTSGPFTYNLVSVKETGTSTQCSNSITGQSAIVTVNPTPNVTASSIPSDGLICAGSNVTLNGGGANTYSWTAGVNNGIAFSPVTSSTYTVTGTDGNGCTNTATKTVTVKDLPNTPISNPQQFVYDGISHNGTFQIATGEDINWFSAANGTTISALPTQTNVGKNEAFAEAKLLAAPYCVSANRAKVSVEITPAPIAIKGITGASKVYDGTTIASINGTPAYDGLVAADAGFTTVQGGPSYNFDNKDAGTNKTITVSGFTVPSTNYNLTQPTGLTASITPAPITIEGIAGVSRIYDGTTNATVTGTPIYTGLVAGESLTVVGSPLYTFSNKNVGVAKPITVTGFLAPNANYTLTAQPNITADITPKLLNVTGTIPDRMYDASTNTPGLNLKNDALLIDNIIVSRNNAVFDNANAGVNKDILVTGLSIFPNSDAANYYLASTTATVKGTIKPLQINIVANDATKTELDPDPSFTYQPVSLLGTDLLTGALSRFPGETAGDYLLTIGTLSAGPNYFLNLNAAKLTIKPLITNYVFEVPTAFTPNQDMQNDELKIIKNYRVQSLVYFRIYNRAGQLVFETKDLNTGWNGRRMGDSMGNVLESDLYIWIAAFTALNEASLITKTGSVLLLK